MMVLARSRVAMIRKLAISIHRPDVTMAIAIILLITMTAMVIV
jgi:hypothetical protein